MIFNLVQEVGSQPAPILDHITITANGVYEASTYGLDGFDKVTVNLEKSGGLDMIQISMDIVNVTISQI